MPPPRHRTDPRVRVFHRKTTPPAFVTPESCLAMLRRFGHDKVERFTALRAKFGDPDLTPLISDHGHPLT